MRRKGIKKQPKIGTGRMRFYILVVFILLIVAADLSLLFFHGREFSESENRILQKAPAFTVSSLLSGRFMTQEENHVSDQFFLRDAWISLKLFLDRASGKVESNGVYLGKQGYLLEIPSAPNEEYFMRNLDAIKKFAESTDKKVVMTLVPPAAWVLEKALPNHAPLEDVGAVIERAESYLSGAVDFVDVTKALKLHQDEPIYYKSDHHWKSLGARYAFEAMVSDLGVDNIITDYAVMDVTHDFSGTMASNSGASGVKDSIEIYVPVTGKADGGSFSDQSMFALSTELEYVVEYTDTQEKSATVFVSEALSGKDKYQVFMGGNHPLINIKTNKDNGKSLLVLKDSYFNSFIQFILPYYSRITVVDPRYYSDDLSRLMSDNAVTEVLILYSENTFVTDNSLFGVLEDMVTQQTP